MAAKTETLVEQSRLIDAVANFDHLPDSSLVDQKAVQALVGCGATSVWRWVRNGTLPAPIRLGRAVRWRVGDLRALFDGKAGA